MIVQVIWCLIYFALWALLLIGVVIALCSLDRVKHLSINVVLAVATLIIGWSIAGQAPAFQAARPVVKQQETVADENASPQPAEVVQAEMAPAALKRAHFLNGINSSIRPFLLWEWGKNPDKEIAQANAVVQGLARKYPLDAPLAARAIILRHWQGDNALTAIDDYSNGGGIPDQLLMTLYTIYSVPKGGDLQENIKNIEAELKPGWYRDTALMDAYKAAGAEQYETAQQAEKGAALFWQIRFFTFEILKALAAVVGLYVIFKFFPAARTDFEPLSKDFAELTPAY